MPIATLFELAERVERHIPRCPRPAIHEALRDAWHTLCEDGEAFRKSLSVTVQPGTVVYALNPGVEASVSRIGAARWRLPTDVTAGRPGVEVPVEALRLFADGNGHHFVDLTHLVGPGGADGTLDLTVVLSPVLYAEDEPDVPQEILAKWGRALAALAVSILAGEPGAPWYDPQVQAGQLMIYNAALNRVRREYAPVRRGLFQ